MKKIALVTKGFTGSTLPLVKQFLAKGYAVDLFLFNYLKIDDLEAFSCQYHSSKFGIEQIPNEKWSAMNHYLGDVSKLSIFSLRMPRPYLNIPILSTLIYIYSLLYAKKVSSFINSKDYAFVNIICGYYSKEYLPIIRLLKPKVIVSLHEVCDHFNPDFNKPSALLKYLFTKKIDIIIYSDNSYNDILNYKEVDRQYLHRVNFGLFESFEAFLNKGNNPQPEGYILFFGSILPYKGLGVLYKAVLEARKTLPNMKVLVAGKGSDESLELMKGDDSFEIINKRLTNHELAGIIQGAKIVVCPYLTMSQSGIPQTVYPFKKPIIASDLKGFKEVINDGVNGMLFKTGDAIDLSNKIIEASSNIAKYNEMITHISLFGKEYPKYSWEVISQYYIDNFDKE